MRSAAATAGTTARTRRTGGFRARAPPGAPTLLRSDGSRTRVPVSPRDCVEHVVVASAGRRHERAHHALLAIAEPLEDLLHRLVPRRRPRLDAPCGERLEEIRRQRLDGIGADSLPLVVGKERDPD